MSRSLVSILLTCSSLAAFADDSRSPEDVLVRVDGEPITEADLRFEFETVGVPEAKRRPLRRTYLERLVERKLLGSFLESRNVTARPEAVEAQVARVEQMIRRRDRDPDAVLKQIGYDDESLRRALALPIAWEAYAYQVVRPDDVRRYWRKHRAKFDGTTWRARQILIRLPKDAPASEVSAAREKLAAIRERVLAGELDFAEAAREHSDAPSGARGGDVGAFPYRGKMPTSFTDRVLDLEPGEIAEPFRSRFGMHLVQVTDRTPGEDSLEDVRPAVFDALADEIRQGLIEKTRRSAEIEWIGE